MNLGIQHLLFMCAVLPVRNNSQQFIVVHPESKDPIRRFTRPRSIDHSTKPSASCILPSMSSEIYKGDGALMTEKKDVVKNFQRMQRLSCRRLLLFLSFFAVIMLGIAVEASMLEPEVSLDSREPEVV